MNFARENRLFFVVKAGMVVFASLLFILSGGDAFTQSLEQEGFRFREDDGNESGATWLANQDTNIFRDKNTNTRLRVVVNATGDPASNQYQLEYKKSTDSVWNKVLTAQPSTVLPTYVAAGTIASSTFGITPALPAGIQTDDILLLFVESANQAISISNQNGGTWTEASDSPQGVGTAGGLSATRLAVFWSRYNGTQGAPTVADSGDHTVGRIIAIRGCITSGDPFDVTAGDTEGVSDTSGSIPGDTTTVDNILVVVAITSSYDPFFPGTAFFSNWSNTDLANPTERTDDIRSDGNGGGIGVATGEKASAGTYGATTVTFTNGAYKAMWTGALKPVPVTQEAILISASSNIAASGQNTTAQLTAPSGKTTSNFTSGRIQDDENPADAVDIANNYYTELEWCLIATAAAQYGDVYQFRVTAAGTVLDTYSVTPQWTIYEERFEYRRQITILDSMTVNPSPCSSNLPNFPVLIDTTNWLQADKDKLKTVANGGHVYNSNGYDIIFRSLDSTVCGGTAPCTLDHEIELYDGSAGRLVAWVRIPTLYYNQDTTIYMYYGNRSITTSTENKNGVWDTNYVGVWHLEETSGTQYDSTSSGNHGTASVTTQGSATGQIDGADAFSGTTNYVGVGTTNWSATQGTLELWVYRTGYTSVTDYFFGHDADPSTGYNNRIQLYYDDTTGQLDLGLGGSHTARTNILILTVGTWYRITLTWNAGNYAVYVYGDATPVTVTGTYTGLTTLNTYADIGNNGDVSRNQGCTGTIDEVRISNAARDACWIGTEYNNMSGTGYLQLGTEEGPSVPTAVKLTSFTATEYPGGVLLRWHTGYEVDNLGFHVYREENGQLVRLTPEPVAGSAFLAGKGTSLTAGRRYHWWDTSLGPQSSQSNSIVSTQSSSLKYWVEDIDLSGKRTMHGPVTPVLSREPIPEKFRPELLSERGMRLEERYHHYWRVQELKEKIRSRGLRSVSLKEHSVLGARSFKTAPLKAQQTRLLASSPAGTLLKAEGRSSNLQALMLDPQTQQYLASRPAVKLFVREEGWYRVTQPELVTAGLSPKVNPEYLQLFMEAQEQPIRVIGKGGKFDAIEFYGVGLDTPSTDTRVYWLVEGSRPGKRVDEYKGYSGSLSSLSYLHTIEKKDRVLYFSALKNGDEENFFGPVVSPSGADQLLVLRHLDPAPSEEALLEVILQGATEGTHRVEVLLNEVEVGEVVFEGFLKGLFQVGVPQALLEEGENLVSLIARGGEMDYSLLDLIRLSYWHTYVADGDELKFRGKGGEHLSISGFTQPRIQVVDITDPNNLVEVSGKVRAQGGGYLVEFEVPGRGERRLLACTADRIKSPSETVSNRPSFWSQSSLAYDFVMISHRDFLEALKPLKQLREFQGLSVALIDIEDIYDEFSFGAKTSKAIKDFLTLAKSNWQKPPRFVLLVGDASSDPRNYLGYGDFDFVPTKLVETAYLETASDDWFVDFNEDGLPEMAVGRLPVQTAEETAGVVSKIAGYEKSSSKQEALLVADKADNSNDFNFAGASEELRALLPAYITVKKIFRGDFSSDAQAKAELLSGINQGPLLVNFFGHGSIEIWRGILTSEDMESLINGFRLPFFVNMTCLNGFFQNPYSETLAEGLMKAKGGGAVAVWTSSGLTEPDKQAVMNKELIRLLFNGELLTLGQATARAKASVSDQDVRKTWVLFGDPTTKLRP